jgi:thiamine-phosphate pyrophosphorylase
VASVVRVVVVTDRRLFGSEEIAGRVEDILAAVPRGSVAIQIREKDLDGGPLLHLVHEVLEVTRPAGAPVWVNDRVDVALAAGADGVHLPERGLSIADARAAAARAGRTLAIACSRHTTAGVIAAAAEHVERIHLGPIWAAPGKDSPIGLDPLEVRGDMPANVQLVAVGGIDGPTRARKTASAGADAVAVIRAAWVGDAPAAMIASLVEAVEAGVAMR